MASECVECSGSLSTEGGETFCETCGLVHDEDQIDHGAEWRAFTDSENETRRRTGARRTNRLPDNGLRTRMTATRNIKGSDPLKASRMRHQEYRARTENSHTREAGLSEINRLGAALDLPETYKEQAARFFKKVHSAEISGLTLEGVCGACYYVVCRRNGATRSMHEIEKYLPEGAKADVAYRNLRRKHGLKTPIIDPREYVGRYGQRAGLTSEETRHARELISEWQGSELDNGKNPSGVAGGAVYLAAKFAGKDEVTQTSVSDIADVSTVTVRTRMLEMCDIIGENPIEN